MDNTKLRRTRRKKRGLHPAVLLAGVLLLLSLSIVLLRGLQQTETVDEAEIPTADTYGEIMVHRPEDVTGIRVTREGKGSWEILRGEDNSFYLADESDWTVAEAMRDHLLTAAAVISYDDILAEDPAQYSDQLAELGLNPPALTAAFTYQDGTEAVLQIGSKSPLEDENWYYMLLEGDPRLFALDKGTYDDLNLDRELLHPVEQPVIHKARIDEITCFGPDGQKTGEWKLQAGITDADAALAWSVSWPWAYPADSEKMDTVRQALSRLVFGSYVGAATEENLERYGFVAPRRRLRIHMAAGSIQETNSAGALVPVAYPEGAVTLTVGGQKNDYVDYVLYGDSIYLVSRITLTPILELEPVRTVSRYPVTTPLADLQSLTVEKHGVKDIYTLSTRLLTQEDGSLLCDEEGNPVSETVCTRNGEPYDAEAFTAAYARLETVTVSGTLPEMGAIQAEPHTIYTFVNREGRVHTVALSEFDAFHDAVAVDGCALFYLIKEAAAFGA